MKTITNKNILTLKLDNNSYKIKPILRFYRKETRNVKILNSFISECIFKFGTEKYAIQHIWFMEEFINKKFLIKLIIDVQIDLQTLNTLEENHETFSIKKACEELLTHANHLLKHYY